MFVAPRKIALFGAAVAVFSLAAGSAMAESRTTAAKKVVNGKTVYCAQQVVTGSLVPASVCRTKNEWAALGAKFESKPKALASAAKEEKESLR